MAEGAANGTTVGLTASAIDPNGPATTYSLIVDSSVGGFTINAYTVTVQAQAGAQSTSQSFTIGLTDVASSGENPPMFRDQHKGTRYRAPLGAKMLSNCKPGVRYRAVRPL